MIELLVNFKRCHMYYIAKFLELIGLVILSVGFYNHYPNPMSYNVLIYSSIFFTMGWIIEKYVLKD